MKSNDLAPVFSPTQNPKYREALVINKFIRTAIKNSGVLHNSRKPVHYTEARKNGSYSKYYGISEGVNTSRNRKKLQDLYFMFNKMYPSYDIDIFLGVNATHFWKLGMAYQNQLVIKINCK